MTNEEAKFILQAYRPGGQDAHDPQFAAALEQARQDPELAKWLAEQMAFDTIVTAKVKQVAVPAHLKASILAGRHVIKPSFWSRRSTLLALAASVVLCATVAALYFRPSPSLRMAEFRTEVLADVHAYSAHLDLETKDHGQIQQWLVQHRGSTNSVLPSYFTPEGLMGCRVLDWHHEKVTMFCYGVGNKHLDVLVINRAHFMDAPAEKTLVFSTENKTTTAAWSDGDKVYLVTGHVDEQFLKEHLQATAVFLEKRLALATKSIVIL